MADQEESRPENTAMDPLGRQADMPDLLAEESKPEHAAKDRRPPFLVFATLALFAGVAVLLACWFVWRMNPTPENPEDPQEVAGLPVPIAAPDLDPTYGALLEESKQVACGVVEPFPDRCPCRRGAGYGPRFGSR